MQQFAGYAFALMLLNDRQQVDLPALGIERQKTDDPVSYTHLTTVPCPLVLSSVSP